MEELLACVDEISLEGLDGCPLQHLWALLQRRTPPLQMSNLDDLAKEFLWKGIVQTSGIRFFVVPKPFPHIFDAEYKEKAETDLVLKEPLDKVDGVDVVTHEYQPVSDPDNSVRGSCAAYYTREDVTDHIRGSSGESLLTCNAAYERWGDCLVLVASQALRETALLGGEADPHMPLLDIPFFILEHIGQARYQGRLQRLLSTRLLHLDAKVIFHHMKVLVISGLITRQSIAFLTANHKSYNSNLLHLKRFHRQKFDIHDKLASDVCSVLEKEPQQQMTYRELKEHFSDVGVKRFKLVDQILRQGGYIEFVIPNKEKKGSSKKKPARSECSPVVVLLKRYVCKPNVTAEPARVEEEEGDDDDEQGGTLDRENEINLVAEYPWLNQVYSIIEAKGGQGLSLKSDQVQIPPAASPEILHHTEIEAISGIPHLDCRSLVSTLARDAYIKAVMHQRGRQRVASYVAAPHLQSNVTALNIKKEQDKLKEMRQKIPAAHAAPQGNTPGGSPAGTPGESAANSPCPSPGVSVQETKGGSSEVEPLPTKAKYGLLKQVTYRNLKRRTFIVEYLKNVRLVEGLAKIYRALVVAEEEEGLSARLDRKVHDKIVRGLEEEGLIKTFQTVLQHDGLSQTVQFFLHSSVALNEPAVQAALDRCRFRQVTQATKIKEKLKKEQDKKNKEKHKQEKETEKQEKKKEKAAKKQQDTPTEKSVTAERKDSTSLAADKADYNKYGSLPKYGRARVLHKLLWQLVYGDPAHKSQRSTESNVDAAQTREGGGEVREEVISRVLDPFFHNEAEEEDNFSGVPSLPMYEHPRGYFRIGDVLAVLPLYIYCKLVYLNTVNVDIDEYALDPEKKRMLVCDLPEKIHTELVSKTRHTQAIFDLLGVIGQMGLVTVLKPSPLNRHETILHLSEGAVLLDTTTSCTHYNQVQAQPGAPFPRRRYVFNTYSALKAYWSDLQCIALNTPLGLVYDKSGSRSREKARKVIKIEEFVVPKITESNIDLPPGDQLGAAGMHKTMFVHLRRNWVRLLEPPPWRFTPRKQGHPKARKEAETETEAPEPLVPSEDKAPTKGADSTTNGAKGKKTRKRGKSKDQSDHDGSPVKKKKTKDKGEAVKPAGKEQTSRGKPLDDEDARALARRQSQRAIFSPEEDSLLLVCKVGLILMKRESMSSTIGVELRKILHASFETSEDKTSKSLTERVRRLAKNPQTQFNLRVVCAELATHEEFKNVGDPDLPFMETFHDVVKKLRETLSGSDPVSTGAVALESSLETLHDKYTIQTVVAREHLRSDREVLQLGAAINNARDVRKEVIRDLMQIAFTTSPEKYDAYRVFKMFDDFNSEDLEWVFKDMQKKNVLNRRRDSMSFLNYYRSIPFASMTYHLSTGYYRVFLRGFTPITTYKECRSFMQQLLKGEKHRLRDPVDDNSDKAAMDEKESECEHGYEKEIFKSGTPGSIVVNWHETVGGHVACILSLMATGQLSVETKIPDELLDMDATEEMANLDGQGGSPRKKACAGPSPAQADKAPKGKSKAASERHGTELRSTPRRKTRDANTATSGGESSAKEPMEMQSAGDAGDERERSAVALTGKARTDKEPISILPIQRQMKSKTSSKASEASRSSPAGVAISRNREPTGKRRLGVKNPRKPKTLTTREREVHQFQLPQCNMVSRFTSEHNLDSLREACSFFESKTELWRTWTRTLSIPVASLHASALEKSSKRASRTALMLKRGAADPTKSVEQLPTRAFNSHDFFSLNPCINTLTLVGAGPPEDSGATSKAAISRGNETSSGQSHTLVENPASFADSKESSGVWPITPVIASRCVLSLDEHLQKCERELGMSGTDLSLARFVHDHAFQRGALGVPCDVLQEKFTENQHNFEQATMSLYDHIKLLCSSQLLYRVGAYEPCFVCHQFIKPWCLTILKAGEPETAEGRGVSTDSSCAAGQTSSSPNDAAAEQSLDIATATATMVTDPPSVGNSSRNRGPTEGEHTCSGGQTESGPTKNVDPQGDAMDTDHSSKVGQGPTEGKDVRDAGPSEKAQVKQHKQKRSFQKSNYVCRPWITIDGDINEKVVQMYEEALMTYIAENPGIAYSKISEHFIDVVRPGSLVALLETLEIKGCITKVVRRMPPKCSLFSKPHTANGQGPAITFYSPTVDCIVKLAAGDL